MEAKSFRTLSKALNYVELLIEGDNWRVGKNALDDFKRSEKSLIRSRIVGHEGDDNEFTMYLGVNLNGCLSSDDRDKAIEFAKDRIVGECYMISVTKNGIFGFHVVETEL